MPHIKKPPHSVFSLIIDKSFPSHSVHSSSYHSLLVEFIHPDCRQPHFHFPQEEKRLELLIHGPLVDFGYPPNLQISPMKENPLPSSPMIDGVTKRLQVQIKTTRSFIITIRK